MGATEVYNPLLESEYTGAGTWFSRLSRNALILWSVAASFVISGIIIAGLALAGQFSTDDNGKKSHLPILSELNSTIFMAETLPMSGFNLQPIQGEISTFEGQSNLLNIAKTSIDVTVMYWNLLVENTTENLALGSNYGSELYAAFQSAAARGVQIRFIQDGSSPPPSELTNLVSQYPTSVSFRLWNAGSWYGGSGIMHMKLWVIDSIHAYIGSANMDWLSLSQVKEVGFVIHNSTIISGDLQNLFNTWWAWGSTVPTSSLILKFYSKLFLTVLTVPCWWLQSSCVNPLLSSSIINEDIMPIEYNTTLNASNSLVVIPASPIAILDQTNGIRRWDLGLLLETVTSAKTYVKIEVMDYLPISMYFNGSYPLNFQTINNAILDLVTATPVEVQLLISYWNHTDIRQIPYLRALNQTASICAMYDDFNPSCVGTLNIKIFLIPGWNSTTYPPYSRVNHCKFALTESSVYVSTNNFEWGYYYNTAGSSIKISGNDDVHGQMVELFDRDWGSEYAVDLAEFNYA